MAITMLEDLVFGEGSLRQLWTRAADRFWAETELGAA